MLVAITREVSPSLNNCEVTFMSRQQIDVARAAGQHQSYQKRLVDLGVRVITLPPEPDLPDAVFVEDTAVVLDTIAIMTVPGSVSRQAEVETIAKALSPLRALEYLRGDATLDGGDVLRVENTLYVGKSKRTNREAVDQLTALLKPHDYEVQSVSVYGCLHFKTGCSYLGRNTLLVNSCWIDPKPFTNFELINVPESEPWAANTLTIGGVTLVPAGSRKTKALLEARGFQVQTVDISELQKAEAGLTCLSILLEAPSERLEHQPRLAGE